MKRYVSVRIEVEVEAPDEDWDSTVDDMVAAARRTVAIFGSVHHAAGVKRKSRGPQ